MHLLFQLVFVKAAVDERQHFLMPNQLRNRWMASRKTRVVPIAETHDMDDQGLVLPHTMTVEGPSNLLYLVGWSESTGAAPSTYQGLQTAFVQAEKRPVSSTREAA